jgi:lysozyme
VDVSQWQPSDIDWQKYKEWAGQWDGISRVAMRSSYGYGYKDQNFEANRAGALAAGITQIIFYHYAYPQYNSARVEANWQKQVVGNIRPQDMLALDFEENVSQATAEWAYEWLTQQQFNYPTALPRLYASSAYVALRLQDSRLAKYPLWLANWQFAPDERPPVPVPWQSYEFVQYTDQATIPGIPGAVDCNIFLGKEPTMPLTKFQQQAADEEWDCQLRNDTVQGFAPKGTGIYQQWLANYQQGIFYGPPVGHERNTVDWNGNPVVKQQFLYAHVEWRNGLLGWYPAKGN